MKRVSRSDCWLAATWCCISANSQCFQLWHVALGARPGCLPQIFFKMLLWLAPNTVPCSENVPQEFGKWMDEEMNTNLQVANPYFFPFKNALLCYNSHATESTLLNRTMHLQGCATIDTVTFQNICITPKWNLDPVTVPLHPLLCSVPRNFRSIFCLCRLAYSGRFFLVNHMTSVLLSQASVTYCNGFKIHLCCSVYQHFIFLY